MARNTGYGALINDGAMATVEEHLLTYMRRGS